MQVKDVAHRALVQTSPVQTLPIAGEMWRKARRVAVRRWGAENVVTLLHGRNAVVNFANPYPYNVRRLPNYNAPQVELVASTAAALGRPVHVVDVGAAIGDTAMLLLERCDEEIARLDCVEGAADFVEILKTNLTDSRVHVHHSMLSDAGEAIPSLVRSEHAGTASSLGAQLVLSTTLDRLFADASPDVVKVDTDGFDGLILAGARALLERARPTVLFEWAPRWCAKVGTDPRLGFDVLGAAGYERFVFFTKYGQFSHFGGSADDSLGPLERLCLESTTLEDWHYDVAALHGSSTVDEVALADLRHWGSAGW